MKKVKQYTFIDLFAGIGGFHIAFSRLGAKCVYVSEYEKYCRMTYEHYFKPRHPELFKDPKHFGGDIKKVTVDADTIRDHIPPFDILTGGFPCQPFSQAGQKKGFLDEVRGTLFHDIVKILDARKPKAYFIENVRGLLNHDKGETIKEMRRIMHNLGYSFRVFPVRASEYGLPTHRPRLYIIGFRGDYIGKGSDVLEAESIYKYKFEPPQKLEKLKFTLSDLFKSKISRDIGYTLRLGGVGSGVDDRRNWDTYRLADGDIHRITVEEAAKMMGFPDKGPDKFTFPDSVSNRERMRQLGNSVAIDAIQAFAAQLLVYLPQIVD